jgi:hypothetical protein
MYLENDSGRAEREGRPPASQISMNEMHYGKNVMKEEKQKR